MLYKQLKYFVAVVQTGSFTEAAERNYISQSAVSQQIKALEEEIGVTLLQRSKRSFTLTKAGKYLYEQGIFLLRITNSVIEETAKIGTAENESRITIGYLKMYLGKELQKAIALFRQQYPDIIIDVKSAGHEELYKGIATGRFDFILNDTCFEDPAFDCRPVKESNVYVDVSEQNSLSENDSVDMDAPKDIPCILVVEKEQLAEERAFYTSRCNAINKFIFAGDFGEARMLVAAGAGFMLIENNDSAFMPVEGLKRLPAYKGGKPLKWRYYFIHRKEKLDRYKQCLAGLIKAQFAAEEQ